ncbi:hypothetical protein ACFQZE_02270 [Paenibacillus sp. GCM10027627]|uniref:hypothetical protein n=1 Tax=unclassified Paenibacillus TaxID=185978 RepID=UPI00363F3A1D
MDKYGDWFVMVIAGVLLAMWLFRSFYRWLHAPATINRVKLGRGGKLAEKDENVELLQRKGYQVISGKHAIPIPIEVDDAFLTTGTRLYIDYMAEKDNCTYIVKAARDRMPMDWTASGIRDRLLMYALLLPDCSGILYINAKEDQIRKITFHIAE